MNPTQKQFRAVRGGTSQCHRILAALEKAQGRWVAMTHLWRVSKAFAVHSRVSDLRERGHVIDHRNEHKGRVIHSFYRLQP